MAVSLSSLLTQLSDLGQVLVCSTQQEHGGEDMPSWVTLLPLKTKPFEIREH